MPTPPPTRIALVGTGGIAAVHARSLAALGAEARIVAATDIDQTRLGAFADEWGIGSTWPSLDAMLDGVELDLVHLCSPPGLHREQAVAVLERGVDVLTEKPPALSLAEFDDIVAAEARGGGRLAVVSQHRFGARAGWLREAVAAGTLGRPTVAVCHTLWFRPDSYFDVPWRGTWDAEGGGPTMGHGIHQIDTLLSILGPWEEVLAVAANTLRPTETEDVSLAVVRMASGASVSIVNSLLSPRETSYLRFDFERATVEVEHLYGYGDHDWRLTVAPDAAEPERQRLRAAWEASAGGDGSGHGAQFRAMRAARAAGGPLPVSSADARPTLELIAAIYASAFTGRAVRAGEIDADSPFYASMAGSGAPWAAAR